MKLLILFLLIYVDDLSSFQCAGQLYLYPKYGKALPSNLIKLLQLWDFIHLLHEERKQIFGAELPIIGFEVDPNLMWIRMSDDSRLQLISMLREIGQHGTCHTLPDFQHIAGHLNWALNVYLMLCPSLCAIYAKMAGKLQQKALIACAIWVNRDVGRELEWASGHLLLFEGFFLLNLESWCYRDLPSSVFRV
ncbi:hypothetical protein PAXRUDRAFT_157513 [Paxillus rubicundulus Ve08.2h10]|uniref:Uncharacterized protein n=1 Tax=Paxillus rubicundulus Ve08.2h10 TaxID=930991 RepID=A0A0D0DHE6_9AGAM|nr:hypothetical protein PAXRUDRAFT_157513 [Paxillus rubicundulus Ve08.2h10]